jgi:aminopeptidase N
LLEVDIDFEKKSVSGMVTHTLEAVGRPVQLLELDAEGMKFHSVSVGGETADYQFDQGKLMVPLRSEMRPGQKLDVQIRYSTTPERGLFFSGPTETHPYRKQHVYTHGWPQESHNWFPCFDYPNMRYSSETIITAPSGMTAVSNGKLISATQRSDNKKSWHFRQELPHAPYLHSVVVGELVRMDEDYKVPLEFYVPPGKETEARFAFSKTIPAMEFFSKITGCSYPYAKYSQAAVDFPGGGTENVSATTLTDEILLDDRSRIDYSRYGDDIVVHELAHQWFGDYLTCKDWSHAWLNEGFATYFTALFREADSGADEFQYFMYSRYMEAFFKEAERFQRSIVTKQYWDPEEVSGRHIYEKGAWVLHGLRGLLGDDAFFRGIRLYVSRHSNSNVETSDLRKALEEASGVDLELFFDQWVYTPGFPDYDVYYGRDDGGKSVHLSVEQTNAGIDGTPLYSTPIEVRFVLRDAPPVKKKIQLTQKKEEFTFSMSDPLLNISIDHDNWVLKKLRFHKPKEMLLWQLRSDENVVERVRACIELSNIRSVEVVEALADRVDSDGFWGVRLEAAKAIGGIGTSKALEALLTRARDTSHMVRQGIAYGLRGFSGLDEKETTRAVDALVAILGNDISYEARAIAGSSLGFYKQSEKAFSAMKGALGQNSPLDGIRRMAILGLAERADKKALPLLFQCLQRGKIQGRLEAIDAIGKLGKGEPDVLKTILSLGKDRNERIRTRAARVLGEMQDRTVLEVLRSWLQTESSGDVRRAIRESIFLLSEGTNQQAD